MRIAASLPGRTGTRGATCANVGEASRWDPSDGARYSRSRAFDPDGLLPEPELGITCALIPTDTAGVEIGEHASSGGFRISE
jgi:hypothetical protein